MKKQTSYQRYGNYIINRAESLGSGTFGKVYRGYRILSQNLNFGNYQRLRLQAVAIKQSICEASNIQQINILKILNHPNIIKYIDYKLHGNSLFMIMQLCEQGTLQDLLMDLPEDQNLIQMLMVYYAQIVAGIRFMYEKSILHRDIKPSNILIKDNMVKIADFGTSRLNEEKELRTLVGTPLFSSPQLLEISIPAEEQLDTPTKSTYTEKSDIWSLGLVLYMMFNYQKDHDKQGERLRNSLPWCGRHAGQVLKNIQTQPLLFKKADVPVHIQQIIRKMLKINPAERMSFKQLFSLQQFNNQSIRQLKLNLSESNLAMSKSYLPDSSLQDSCCLTRAKNQAQQQQARVAEQIQKKQIDYQLLKLLQIKDSEHYENDQIKQAIQLYCMVVIQLRQAKQQSQRDTQLMFLLQKKLFELYSWRMWNIQYQLHKGNEDDDMIRITHGKQDNKSSSTIIKIQTQSINQLLQQIRTYYSVSEMYLKQLGSVVQPQRFRLLIQQPQMQSLTSKEKMIVRFIKPDQKLTRAMKLYIKRNLNEDLLQPFLSSSKIKCNMNLTQQTLLKRKKINLLYDLLIFIQFQFSWKIKSQLSATYGRKYNVGYANDSFVQAFRTLRNSVNIKQVISRIKQAYNYLKIANIQDNQVKIVDQ